MRGITVPPAIITGVLLDPLGRVIKVVTVRNLLTSIGKLWAADFHRGVTDKTAIVTVAIGDSTTAPSADDTILGHEVGRIVIPVAGTNTATSVNIRTGSVVTIAVTIGPGISATIREVGYFADIASPPGSANAGSLINHAAFGPFPMTGIERLKVQANFSYL